MRTLRTKWRLFRHLCYDVGCHPGVYILGSKKSVHFLMLNRSISKISRLFFYKFGMVSPKYTIHRSNIKPMPCWAEIFDLYANTYYIP